MADIRTRLNDLLAGNPIAGEFGYPRPAPPPPQPEPLDLSGLSSGVDLSAEQPEAAPGGGLDLSALSSASQQSTIEGGINTAGRGFVRGALNTVGSSLRGLAGLATMTPEEAQQIADLGLAPIDPNRPLLEQVETRPPQELGAYRLGQRITDIGKRPDLTAPPGWEEGWTDKIATAFGSTAPYLATGALGTAGSLTAGTIAGMWSGAGEAMDRAIAAGATPEQVLMAARMGQAPGATEPLPMEILFRRVPFGAWGKVAGAIGRVVANAAAEGGQEAGQQAMQNIIAKYAYKPGQEIGEGVAEAAALGAVVGGGFSAAGELIPGGSEPAPAAPLEGEILGPEQSPPPPFGGNVERPTIDLTANRPSGGPTNGADLQPLPSTERPAPPPLLPPLQRGSQQGTPPAAPGGAGLPDAAGAGAFARPSLPSSGAEPVRGAEGTTLTPEERETPPQDSGESAPAIQLPDLSSLSSKGHIGSGSQRGPVQLTDQESLARAEGRAATELSDRQIESGVYEKGHARWNGLRISIETPRGGERRSTDKDNPWQATMPVTYGYIRGTRARDKQQVDVYIGPNPQSPSVFVLDQVDPDSGKYDEAKAFIGFDTPEQARSAYEASFSDGRGRERTGALSQLDVPGFKQWVRSGRTSQPYDRETVAQVRRARQEIERRFKDQEEGGRRYPVLSFLKGERGVDPNSPLGGNLRSMGVTFKNFPGLFRRGGRKGFDNIPHSEWAGWETLRDDGSGYVDEDSFMEAVRLELAGSPIVHMEDQAEREERRAEFEAAQPIDRIDEIALDAALREAEADGDQELRKVARQLMAEGMGVDDAIERGMFLLTERSVSDENLTAITEETGVPFDHGGAGEEGGALGPPLVEGREEPAAEEGAGDGAQAVQRTGEPEGQAKALDLASLSSEATPAGQQTVIPGAEQIGQGKLAQRRADAPLRPKVDQKEAGGLFSDESSQTDLVDLSRKPEPKRGATDFASMGPVEKYNAAHAEADRRWPPRVETTKKGQTNRYVEVDHLAFTNGALGNSPLMAMPINVKLSDIADAYEAGILWARGEQDAAAGIEPSGRVADELRQPPGRGADREPDNRTLREGDELPRGAGEPDAAGTTATPRSERDLSQAPVASGDEGTAAGRASETVVAPVVRAFRDHFLSGGTFNNAIAARKFAAENGGIKVKAGTSEVKALEEQIEFALVLAARQIVAENEPAAAYDKLVDLYNRQPKLSARTSKSIADQAYSTPAPLAFLASRLAGVKEAQSILEPTAGNGMLLIEADPKRQSVSANEIDHERGNNLARQGFAPTKYDAASAKPHPRDVDVVIANPPFGAMRGEEGKTARFEADGQVYRNIDQAIMVNALAAMRDGGRAVFIMPSVKPEDPAQREEAYRTGSVKQFWPRIYKKFNVVDHFTVHGDLYERQGAGWPVDVVVIDGMGASVRTLPGAEAPPVFSTWEALKEKLDGRSEARLSGETRRPADSAPERGAEPAGEDAGTRSEAGGERPAGRKPVDKERDRLGERGDRGQPADLRSEPPGPVSEGVEPKERADSGRTGSAPPRVEVKEPPKESGQSAYHPRSKIWNLQTLVPANMRSATEAALERVGDVDTYVADKLGYKKDELERYFGAEQVDALALALANWERGDGFIIGDQTGIGKGRFVAGLLRYAMRAGETPIFFTEKPNLYGDIIRDLNDIGIQSMLGRDVRPFMTNIGERIPLDQEALDWFEEKEDAQNEGRKVPKERGKFLTSPGAEKHARIMSEMRQNGNLGDYDILFSTYDQMNTVKGADTSRRHLFNALKANAAVIFDESHNAGEVQETWKKAGSALDRAEYTRQIANGVKHVAWSSATYAKRPGVMDFYARTDLGKAVEKASDVGPLVAKGGVPLQQIVASMLADAGQYVRRERSFDGVDYDVELTPVSEKDYDNAAWAISRIHTFDEMLKDSQEFSDFKKELAKRGAGIDRDNATGKAGVTSTNFTALMHNVVNQLGLALKADPAADRAIKALKDDEKVVIGLMNTMEAFVRQFAVDEGLNVGDEINIGFDDLLRRYLERTRRVTIKDEDNNRSHFTMPVEMFGSALSSAYADAHQAIAEADLGRLPVSPIDWITNRLQKAGYKVGEITGRSMTIDYSQSPPRLAEREAKAVKPIGKRQSINNFNNGRLDALIINRSGSTGLSLHASPKVGKDLRRRRMVIVQPELNIDTHMQMLGRVHRTGQVIPPAYSQIVADVPSEARPAAVLQSKMASLNANTTANRKSKFSGDSVDFMNQYGDAIVSDILADDETLNARLGYPLGEEIEGAARKVTGRLMLLPAKEQREILDRITTEYKELIEQKDALGENALEAKALELDAKTVEKTQIKEKIGASPFTDGVYIEKLDVKSPGKALSPDEILSQIAQSLGVQIDASSRERMLMVLREKGAKWAASKVLAVTGAHAAFTKKIVGGLKNPEAKAKREKQGEATRETFRKIMQFASPGKLVRVEIQGSQMPAYVLGIGETARKDDANPLALSAWKLKLAIPNSASTVSIPFTQIAINEEKEDTAKVKLEAADWAMRDPQVFEVFERARKEGRDTRYMVTGNIPAGYDLIGKRGQIVTFRRNDGTMSPGILQPQDFDLNAYMKERPVRFTSGDQVRQFIAKAPSAEIKSADGLVTVQKSRGEWEVETPASKQAGGRYYLDDRVRRASADGFAKVGSKMRFVTANPQALGGVIDALIQAGAVFETRENQDEAVAIIKASRPKEQLAPPRKEQKQRRQVDEIISDVLAIIEKMAAPGTAAEIVEKVTTNNIESLRASGFGSPDDPPILGKYNRLRGIITVSMEGNEQAAIASHESWHSVEPLITDAEWKMLRAEEKRLHSVAAHYLGYDGPEQIDLSFREKVATAAEAYFVRKQAKGLHIRVRAIFDRIARILRSIRNYMRGLGVTTAEDVFDLFHEGKVRERGMESAEVEGEELHPAWHGTKVKGIEKLSTAFIGTGEGAQAYGWGLYFASAKGVADYYRRKLSGSGVLTIKGLPDWNQHLDARRTEELRAWTDANLDLKGTDNIGHMTPRTAAANARTLAPFALKRVLLNVQDKIFTGDTAPFAHAAEEMEEFAERATDWRDKFDRLLGAEVARQLESSGLVEISKPGALYRVELAPSEDEYLDWDKPLSEQSEKVKAIIEKKWGRVIAQGDLGMRPGMSGDAFYQEISRQQGAIHGGRPGWRFAGDSVQNDKRASEALHKAGIRGIRYLDQGSRSSGEGSHNYVIFSDDDISIEEQLATRRARAPDPNRVFETPEDRRALRGMLRRMSFGMIREGVNVSWVDRKWANRAEAMGRTMEAIQASNGPLPDQWDLARAEQLYAGRAGERLFQLRVKRAEPIMQRLRAIRRRAGSNSSIVQEFNDFLYAAHALERNRYIRTINPNVADPSGMSDQEARAILQRARTEFPEFAPIALDVYAMLREGLERRLNAGLITQEQFDEWTQRYNHYVPLRGWEDEEYDEAVRSGRGYDLRGPEFRAAMGRDSKADLPLAYAIQQAQESIIRSEKNRVAKRLLRLAMNFQNKQMWEVNKAEKKRRINPTTGMVEEYWVPPPAVAQMDKDQVFVVKAAGKQRYVTVHHEGLRTALKMLGAEHVNGVVKFLSLYTRFLSKLYTQLDPEFVFRNLARDMQTALLHLSEEQMRGLARAVALNTPQASRGMWNYLRGKDANTSTWTRYAHEFAADGGKVSFFNMESIDDQKRKLSRAIDGRDWRKVFTVPLDVIEDINGSVENAIRLSTYVNLRQRGYSRDKAASVAKNLTVDFNRKGEWSQAINALYLFFNASTQGSLRIARAASRSKRVRQALGAMVVLGLVKDWLNWLLAGDDDDGQNRWDKVPQYEKDRNFILMMPNGEPWIKFPMPYGYNAFVVMGEQIGAMTRKLAGAGKGVGPIEAAATTAAAFANAFVPIDVFGSSPLQTVAPTIADPFVEMAENRNYFGGPIYPTKYDERSRDSDLAFRGVNPMWRSLAQALSEFTDFDLRKPPLIDVSPESLEHLAETYMGGAGTFWTERVGGTALKFLKGEKIETRDIPFVRTFVGQITDYVNQGIYYDLRDQVLTLSDQIETAEDAGHDVDSILRNYPVESAVISDFKYAEKQLAKLRRERRINDDDPAMSAEERRKANDVIEKEMDEIRAEARKAWESAREGVSRQ